MVGSRRRGVHEIWVQNVHCDGKYASINSNALMIMKIQVSIVLENETKKGEEIVLEQV